MSTNWNNALFRINLMVIVFSKYSILDDDLKLRNAVRERPKIPIEPILFSKNCDISYMYIYSLIFAVEILLTTKFR